VASAHYTEEIESSGIVYSYQEFFEGGDIDVALWDTIMYSFAGRTQEDVLPRRDEIMVGRYPSSLHI
jgi:hypothetical protein